MEIRPVGGHYRRHSYVLRLALGQCVTHSSIDHRQPVFTGFFGMQFGVLVQGSSSLLGALLSDSVIIKTEFMGSC